MSRLYLLRKTAADLEASARDVLVRTMAPYGFHALSVKTTREFDGDDVFRIVAEVAEKVPVPVVRKAADEIQQLLREDGDDRWIMLSTHRMLEEADDDDAGKDVG